MSSSTTPKQDSTPPFTSSNEERPIDLGSWPEDTTVQHFTNPPTQESLFKHFVGGSDSADQQNILSFFKQVLDIGVNFKSQPKVRNQQVENQATISFDAMPEKGLSSEELLECFSKIAKHSTNFASPKFMGFPDAANSLPALGAAMLVPFINQNMCNQDIQAPAASFVEMEVVHWLRLSLGFPVHLTYNTVTEIGEFSLLSQAYF